MHGRGPSNIYLGISVCFFEVCRHPFPSIKYDQPNQKRTVDPNRTRLKSYQQFQPEMPGKVFYWETETKSNKTCRGNKCWFCKILVEGLEEFQIFLSNQKLARALTSSPKAIAPANTSCCLATSGTNTAGSVPSRRRDFAIISYLFPRLKPVAVEMVFHYRIR